MYTPERKPCYSLKENVRFWLIYMFYVINIYVRKSKEEFQIIRYASISGDFKISWKLFLQKKITKISVWVAECSRRYTWSIEYL